jgi:hypothetical protein
MTTRIRIENLGPSTIIVTRLGGEAIEVLPQKATPSRSSDSCLYVYDGREFIVSEKKGT